MISRIAKVVMPLLVGAVFSSSVTAHDIYDPATGVLYSPYVQVDNTIYTDVHSLLSPGGTIAVLSVGGTLSSSNQLSGLEASQVTSYSSASGKLDIPMLQLGYTYYPSVVVNAPLNSPWVIEAVGSSFIYIGTTAADTGLPFAVAPSILNGEVGSSQNVVIAGGKPFYFAQSSNESIVSLEPMTTTTGVKVHFLAAGATTVVIGDSNANLQVVTVNVQKSTSSTTAIAISPSEASGKVGETLTFAVTGGTGGVSVVTNNPSVASCSASSSTTPLTVNCQLITSGTSAVTVTSGTEMAAASITVTDNNGTTPSTEDALFIYPTKFGGIVGSPITFTIGGGKPPYFVAGYDMNIMQLVSNPSTGPFIFNPIASTGEYTTYVLIGDSAGTIQTAEITITAQANPNAFYVYPEVVSLTAGMSVQLTLQGGVPPFKQILILDPSNFILTQLSTREFKLTVRSGTHSFTGYTVTFEDATGARAKVTLEEVEAGEQLALSVSTLTGAAGDEIFVGVFGGAPPYKVSIGNQKLASVAIIDQSIFTASGTIRVNFLRNNGAIGTTFMTVSDSESNMITIPIILEARKPPVVSG